MTPQVFVEAYMGLIDAYGAMTPEEREAVTTAFVRARSDREGWRVLAEEAS